MKTLDALFRARVEENPNAEAVVFGDRRMTYGQLEGEVDRVSRGLHARGVRHGDRVLTLAGNLPEVIAIYLAVGRLGAVYVPVSTGFRAREMSFVLRNAEPKLAIVEAASLDEFVRWAGQSDIDLVVLGSGRGSIAGTTSFDELGVGERPAPQIAVEGTDPLLLCYTSGTTSTPKPVLHSQDSEAYNATTYAAAWSLGAQDRGIVCLPLAWVFGLSTTTAAMLVSGSSVILLPRFHPAHVIDAVERTRATAMWGTMSMYTKMLEVIKDRGTADLSSLRVALNGGEPCPPPLVNEFEKLTGVHLQGSYATSEVRPVMVVRPGDRAAPEGTVGKLVPGAQIRLERPDGVEVEVGEVGHAFLRSGGMMTAYYGEPELTAERVTEDGWLRTGDLMRADEDGYYFVVGRHSEMIIRSGVNIAPAEVEAALVALPGIAEAAVVGVPDRRSGESIRAAVVAERGMSPSEDEIRQALAGRLAAYKVPQEFIFVEELPRTDRGKVNRRALQSLEASTEISEVRRVRSEIGSEETEVVTQALEG